MRGPTSIQHNTLLKLFPLPRFVDLPAAGIDVSDRSVKFIELLRTHRGIRPGRFGERDIPEGVVVSGEIAKRDELVKVLSELKKEVGLRFVRASLPEEEGFLFESSVPRGITSKEARSVLELRLRENVPIAPEEAVFDYEVIGHEEHKKKDHVDVVVSVFPRIKVEKYVSIFKDAGLEPLSLEIEAQAIARAVVKDGDLSTYMIVDFGKRRSGISIISGGTIRFTTTVDIGGDELTKMLRTRYPDKNQQDLDEIKNTKGIQKAREGEEVSRALMQVVDGLREEINKHYVYWHTHMDEDKKIKQKIEKVILCGGHANLAGLPEYLSKSLKVPVERGNVWTNTFELDEYVPPIHFRDSLGYAPSIGLALHSDTQRVIPE